MLKTSVNIEPKLELITVFHLIYKICYEICRDSIRDDPKMILDSYLKKVQTISFVERRFEKLGRGHRTMVSCGVHSDFPKNRPDMLNNKLFRYIMNGSGLKTVFKELHLLILLPFLGLPLLEAPLIGTQVFTLYIPFRLILTLHLFIRQAPIRIPIPSAASPCFLLVALTEATLFRRLLSLIWLGRLWTHLVRR